MKIAVVTPGGVDRSGVHRVIPCLLWFIERLAKSGDEVHVFALRQESVQGEWALLGATVHNAGGNSPLVRAMRMLADLRREHHLARFDVIHALWAVPQGGLSAIAGRLLGIPVVLHLPGGDIARLPDIGYGARCTAAGRLALRLAVGGAEKVLTLSDAMVEQAVALDIAADRFPFGVALDRWPILAPRRREPGKPLRLLQVADLSPVKDQETLLAAAQHLRTTGLEFILHIVGADTLGGAIQARALALGPERCVQFHGFLPQAVLREWMCATDILVVSSRHEAGPIVALEAAACGVPTVGTKVGLLADWSPDAARAVAVGDGLALGAAIAELGQDEARRLRIAFAAQRRAAAENADVTTEKIRQLYQALVDARGRDTRGAAPIGAP
jgi:glycosyltransferase involved in cell wall biosynthesis